MIWACNRNNLLISLVLLMPVTPTKSATALMESCGYSVEFVPPPACSFGGATAFEVGDAGHVTGYYSCPLAGTEYAFLWQADSVQVLPKPSGYSVARGLGVNSNGDVSGWMGTLTPGFIQHAFRYSNAQTIELPLLPGHNQSEGLGIAPNAPIVVGYSQNSNTGPLTAVVWEDGQVTPFALPLGPYGVAQSINAGGQIVGWMGPSFTRHGFIWDNGKITDLGVIPGGDSSDALSINDRGDVVGRGRVPLRGGPSGEKTMHAFIYFDGVMTDIGTLPGYTRSDAFSVNNDRVVVGHCSAGGLTIGFVWRDGVMTALQDLIPYEAKLNITLARSVNEVGQIAGKALDLTTSQNYAVLLTPISSIPGDTNCNKIVDVDDLLTVINGWGTCKKFSPCPGDLLENDVVDVDDLLMVINNWS